MKFFLLCLLMFVFFVPANIANASSNDEIIYLLDHLENSGCTFIRNGTAHDAKEARDHLEMKYDYAKKKIKTAEDFINKLASKSSITWKKYEVHCGKIEMTANQWLNDALTTYRQNQK